SLMPGRRLRRNRALARQAQPSFQLLPIDAELAPPELQDLQRWLDRIHDLVRAPSRRADHSRRSLRAGAQAPPYAAIDKPRRHVLRELRALVIFVEYVKAAAVEHELERPTGRRFVQEVDSLEAAAPVRLGPRMLDGDRRDVDAHNVEPMLRQVDRV